MKHYIDNRIKVMLRNGTEAVNGFIPLGSGMLYDKELAILYVATERTELYTVYSSTVSHERQVPHPQLWKDSLNEALADANLEEAVGNELKPSRDAWIIERAEELYTERLEAL